MKKLSLLLVVSLLTAALGGCGGGDVKKADSTNSKAEETSEKKEAEGKGSDGEKITIKIAHGSAEPTAMNQACLEFGKILKEETDGRINVEVYPNTMLGSDRENIEAVQMGNIQMAVPPTAPLANFVSEFYLWDVPFTFSTREQVFEIADSDVGKEILNTMDRIGIIGLGVWENGFRDMTCNGGPRTTPEKLQGLKIRCMENDVHMEIWKAVGCNPTPMAFGELFTALQQKTVDAQENPLQLIYETKFYEVQDTVVETRHVYAPFIPMINKAFFESLSQEDQSLIMDAFKKATDFQRKQAAINEDECREKLIEAGCNVVQITDEERGVFAEKTKYIYDMIKEKSGNPELAAKFFTALESEVKK